MASPASSIENEEVGCTIAPHIIDSSKLESGLERTPLDTSTAKLGTRLLDNSSRCGRMLIVLIIYLLDLENFPSKFIQSDGDSVSALVGSIPNSSNLTVGVILAFSICSSC